VTAPELAALAAAGSAAPGLQDHGVLDHGLPDPGVHDYESLRLRAEEAKEAGRLEEALRWYGECLVVARRSGDAELVDRATCNEATVAIALGVIDTRIPPLREILTRNGSPTSCYLASYHLARAYELRKEPKKCLFYARMARERAEQVGQPQRRAAAYNQMGNALLAESSFEDAAASYRQALATMPEELADWRLLCHANLGYCEVMLGRHRPAASRLYRALRAARRGAASPRIEMMIRLDLCFALMELGRLGAAERHALRAHRLVQEIGEVGEVKNCLYLLGQVAVLQDRLDEAREWFGQLQRRFYPEQPRLADFLVGVDVRKMINLRA
jgi:tetratricopeptide (TPR) repeat protein